VLVAATTDCFGHLSLEEAIDKIADLEFTSLEIDINENGNHIKPSEVADNVGAAVIRCSSTRRLDLVAYRFESNLQGEPYFEQFEAICNLAKLTRVVTITVPSAEHGTPFNEEVERLKRLVVIGESHGVRVGMQSQVDRLSEDPDTVSVICDHVKGLGLAYDPSHYIYQQPTPRNTDKLLKYVHHVYLRDTTKDQLQIRVGQGDVDYGKLVGQLAKLGYRRALSVDIRPCDETDHFAEMRKIRLLLESLLI
jgi:sugar phosphate isomerase/epimerase